MDKYVNERDFQILEDDKYTFAVLRRIMNGECELVLTDHERLIIFYTGHPYPVWIWTPTNVSEAEMERAYNSASDYRLLDGEHRINMKYELASYFMKRAASEGKNMSVSMNMFAYDCVTPIKPTQIADGSIYRCKTNDIEELAEFMDMFHNEVGIDQKNRNAYRLDAENCISAGKIFFWKNKQGRNVASCQYVSNGDMASINFVFTHPDFRRMHYAENLVYEVTQLVKQEGYVPMLYTNADYIASNACYEKIGYVLKGKLCTIG